MTAVTQQGSDKEGAHAVSGRAGRLPGRVLRLGLGAGLLATFARGYAGYLRAASDPARVQEALLKRVLRQNADAFYGRRHRFSAIDSIERYQSRVPVCDYDTLSPLINRAAAGEQRVLTSAPVRMFECSGGSTQTTKLIPYTEGLLADFGRATQPWLFDLFVRRPSLIGKRSYWSVSAASREQQRTTGGLPIGFEDDASYFGALEQMALRQLMAVRSEVGRIASVHAWRRATALALLGAVDLGMISVWSPSFLTRLIDYVNADWSSLASALPRERRNAIEAGLGGQGGLGRALFPSLELISCWTDGPSTQFLPALRAHFPWVEIQSKGLLATEGVVSIPLDDAGATDASQRFGGPLAVASHFLEFVNLDDRKARPRLAHELEVGARYTPLLTTSGGLYRYHLKDIVEVTGTYRGTARVRFVEKLERVSDLCGEKVHAMQVQTAIDLAANRLGVAPRFAMVAPTMSRSGTPHYRLYLELPPAHRDAAQAFAACVEDHLRTGYHYRYAQGLEQLGPLDTRPVTDGLNRYIRARTAQGQKEGDIKPTVLELSADWDSALLTNEGDGSHVRREDHCRR